MQNNVILCASLAIAVVTSGGLRAETKDAKAERAELAAHRAAMAEKFGGFVIRPGKGQIGIYDCQKRLDWDFLSERAASLSGNLGEYEVRVLKAEAPKPGSLPTRPEDSNVAVFVLDDATLPMSIVAPEARWGIVNVAALAKDAPDAAKLQARSAKMIAKVAAMVCGSSQTGSGALTAVSTLEELDASSGTMIPPDALANISNTLRAYGLTARVRATYTRACREGWAPAPTNDSQKAVWDKVHALPTKPIKIKYDPKKGE